MEALVMHRFLSLVGRFGRDERGVFAVLFGLIAVVLVAMGGAAVDYVRLEQARNRAQTALDAAVLALQPQIFATPLNQTDILAKAKALVADRIGANSEDFGAISDVDVIQVDVANGSLFLEGSISLQTIFVGMVGVPELSARFHAEATRRMLNLEVAMVLDNSGSMGSFNRMTYLKRAANCATNILFYDGAVNRATTNCNPNTGATVSTNVRIGIVPFTTMVNVGTNNSNAAWLDWAGASSIAKLNFDTRPIRAGAVVSRPGWLPTTRPMSRPIPRTPSSFRSSCPILHRVRPQPIFPTSAARARSRPASMCSDAVAPTIPGPALTTAMAP
jgi:Flp pilus assembly protein TadG